MSVANIGVLLGVLAIWWIFGSMVHMRRVGLHGDLASWVLVFALQAAILFVTILAHEGGHLLAGRLVGFRVQEIALGPLQIRRTGRGLAIMFNNCLPWLGGGAMSAPGGVADATNLRWRAAIVAAGGPLASLFLTAWAAVPLIGYTLSCTHRPGRHLKTIDFWIIFSLSLILIWSLAGFVGNTIPASVGGRLTDGAMLLALLRGGPWAERYCALIIISGASLAGERPRDWDVSLLRPRLHQPPERSAPSLSMALMAYYWLLDRHDAAGAGALLDEILGEVPTALPMMRVRLILEAAYFEARHRHNASAARTWLSSAKGTTADRHMRLRAESAVLLAEGRCQEAWKQAQAGLFALKRAMNTGIAQVEAEWLCEIRDLAQVRGSGDSC
jgi:Peptidase family M50